MLGMPKYKKDDLVTFKFTRRGQDIVLTGKVFIIDPYGTFDQSEEVSYDIMAPDPWNGGEMCLFKHVPESYIISSAVLL